MPKTKTSFIVLALLLLLMGLVGGSVIYFTSYIQPQNIQNTAKAAAFISDESAEDVKTAQPIKNNSVNLLTDTTTELDSTQSTFDKTWKLPFRSGTKILLDQGYNGKFSHQNKYALDFPYREHIDILAAQGGKIITLYNGGKWDQWCTSYLDCNTKGNIARGNHIFIQHQDGTRAKYLHFHPNSIPKNLEVGSIVKQGDFLGKMGSTGYTCLTPTCAEPDIHLHFEVMEPTTEKTITTIFNECGNPINKCDSSNLLIEGNYYTAN
jgi:murein DD-endopeptidase MepM/ murein hydrolase activator NlpD